MLWLRSLDRADYVAQASHVEWIGVLWHFRQIYFDATADAVNGMLLKAALPVYPIQFTTEAGQLVMPRHPPLRRKLSTFDYHIPFVGAHSCTTSTEVTKATRTASHSQRGDSRESEASLVSYVCGRILLPTPSARDLSRDSHDDAFRRFLRQR